MIRVSGYFKDHKVVRYFVCVYDAIDFRDVLDANYPMKVTFEKGVYPMRTFIVNSWNTVMDDKRNPLSAIPDTGTRHMIMQVLAWMWCIVFGFIVGSWTLFGISAIVHLVLLAAIAITVGTFETARRAPQYFGGLGRGNGGEHE